MNGWRPVVVPVAAVAIAAACASCGGSARPRDESPATAFARLVRERQGGAPARVGCRRLLFPPKRVACLAVLRRGATLTEISAATPAPPAAPRFSRLSVHTRVRRWRALSSRLVHSVAVGARVAARANAPIDRFDWAWLIGGALAAKLPSPVGASDGPSDEPDLVIRFRCSRTGRVILCVNAVGDALRLRLL